MSISVKFFARLREQVGKADVTLESANTVQSAWEQASGGMPMPDNTLCAINMEYTQLSATVRDGDEVAFFPPVTGGCSGACHAR